MPTYSYTGRGKDKQFIEGDCENQSIEEAISALTSQGITLINIEAKDQKNWIKAILTRRLDKPHVKIQEMLIFCRQMYTLTKAGISLIIAIRRLAEISRNPDFKDTLHGLERGILAGQTLALCLKRYPAIFSPLFVQIIGLGEESGKLDEAFKQIGDYLLLEYETKKRFKAAIRYPLMVFLVIIAAIIVVNVFVIPNFANLYSSFKTELPLPTMMMIGFSNFLTHYWVYIVFGFVLIAIAFRFYLQTPAGKIKWHRYQFKIPLIGPILERIMLSRFARTMAIVFVSGVPLEHGIGLVAGAVGNEYAKEKIHVMQKRIQNGENLSKAAAAIHLFSPLTLQMMAVGEETGALEVMLQEIALFYEREVDYDLESLGDKIEPVLLFVVAGMVLMLAIAVFLPMWDIYQFAQGK
jgi:MSHA biogenesis protein MshG